MTQSASDILPKPARRSGPTRHSAVRVWSVRGRTGHNCVATLWQLLVSLLLLLVLLALLSLALGLERRVDHLGLEALGLSVLLRGVLGAGGVGGGVRGGLGAHALGCGGGGLGLATLGLLSGALRGLRGLLPLLGRLALGEGRLQSLVRVEELLRARSRHHHHDRGERRRLERLSLDVLRQRAHQQRSLVASLNGRVCRAHFLVLAHLLLERLVGLRRVLHQLLGEGAEGGATGVANVVPLPRRHELVTGLWGRGGAQGETRESDGCEHSARRGDTTVQWERKKITGQKMQQR